MKRSAAIVLTLCLSIRCWGTILPDERDARWATYQPGVKGGIPTVSTVFTNMAGLDATGAVNVQPAIQAAIDSCPSNQVVFLPSGTFLITSPVHMHNGVVLRGNGMTNTTLVLQSTSAATAIQFGPTSSTSQIYYPNNNPLQSNDVYSGATRWSTNIQLSPGPYLAGYSNTVVCLLDDTNDPAIYAGDGADGDAYLSRGSGSRMLRQMIEITNVVDGTNVFFTPPCIWNYTNIPQVVYFPFVRRKAGVENLCVTNACNANLGGDLVAMSQSVDCWLKDCKVLRGHTENVLVSYCLRCTVRGCEIDYVTDWDHPNGAYALEIRYAATQNLIEDNLLVYVRSGFVTTSCGPYNVYGYNYVQSCYNGDAGTFKGFNMNHGGNPWFVLAEGNIAGGFGIDFFHGSSVYQTMFRNWCLGWYPNPSAVSTNYYQRAIDFWCSNYWHSVIGNVLGSPNIAMGNSDHPNWVYQFIAGDTPTSSQPAIYKLGFFSVGSGTACDTNTLLTLLRHGNYDYANNDTIWDPAIADHALPDSLYLTNKPSWFGDLTWPPFGPDVVPMTNAIPALNRYLNQLPMPTPPSGVRRVRVEAVRVGTLKGKR